jgi:hypothetical protein
MQAVALGEVLSTGASDRLGDPASFVVDRHGSSYGAFELNETNSRKRSQFGDRILNDAGHRGHGHQLGNSLAIIWMA